MSTEVEMLKEGMEGEIIKWIIRSVLLVGGLEDMFAR